MKLPSKESNWVKIFEIKQRWKQVKKFFYREKKRVRQSEDSEPSLGINNKRDKLSSNNFRNYDKNSAS